MFLHVKAKINLSIFKFDYVIIPLITWIVKQTYKMFIEK